MVWNFLPLQYHDFKFKNFQKCCVPSKVAAYSYSIYCTYCMVNLNEKCSVPRKLVQSILYSEIEREVSGNQKVRATCLYSTFWICCTVNSNEKCRVPRKIVQPVCTVHIVPAVQWTRMRSVVSQGSLQPACTVHIVAVVQWTRIRSVMSQGS